MKTVSKKTSILFILLFFSFFIFGQKDSTKKNNYYLWGNFGFNTALSSNGNLILGPQFGLNFSMNQKSYFKIHVYLSGTTDGDNIDNCLNCRESHPNTLIYLKNSSLQYGIIHYNSKSSALIISTGISFGLGQYRGKYLYSLPGNLFAPGRKIYEVDDYYYWGVPIDFTIIWPKPKYGFSIDIFANFHKHSDFGIRLNWNVGKIRTL